MGINLNKKAWETLTRDEQSSITLNLGMSKSSWEAGEIINRSHYKYLEIQYRAKHFLKLFTEHLEIFDRLIPDDLPGDKRVVLFFQYVVEYRKKPMKAIKLIKENNKITKSVMNKLVIDHVHQWFESNDARWMAIHDFIKEFDRWNNFRILPKKIQEPSAYKRRVKNVHKKHLRIITSIHPLSFKKLLKHFETRGVSHVYMPIIKDRIPSIHKMKVNDKSWEILCDIGLYIFSSKEVAREYLDLVEAYVLKSKKECIDGLNFWPKYRDIIKLAQNYHDVQKITPTRKHLKMALEKLEYL